MWDRWWGRPTPHLPAPSHPVPGLPPASGPWSFPRPVPPAVYQGMPLAPSTSQWLPTPGLVTEVMGPCCNPAVRREQLSLCFSAHVFFFSELSLLPSSPWAPATNSPTITTVLAMAAGKPCHPRLSCLHRRCWWQASPQRGEESSVPLLRPALNPACAFQGPKSV